jgi:hypothetical protein
MDALLDKLFQLRVSKLKMTDFIALWACFKSFIVIFDIFCIMRVVELASRSTLVVEAERTSFLRVATGGASQQSQQHFISGLRTTCKLKPHKNWLKDEISILSKTQKLEY